MQNRDKYEILTKATELIYNHMSWDKTKQDADNTIAVSYKVAENDLLGHIESQVESINTIADLVECFYYSCCGIQALGLRSDLLEKKLIGTYKDGAQILIDAVYKYTLNENSDPWELAHPMTSEIDIGVNTFKEPFSLEVPHKRALAAMVLLDYAMNGNYEGLDIGNTIFDLSYGSCIAPLLKDNWTKRSIVGYYIHGHDFIFKDANKKFISLFAKTLKELLSKEQSILALQIKQYLHNIVVVAWSDYGYVDALTVYVEVENLIIESKSSLGITGQFVESLQYCKGFALKKHYDTDTVSYEIDHRGLKSLIDMLKALGLEDLQEAIHFIDMVKAFNE